MKRGFFGVDNATKEKALIVATYCLAGLLLVGLGMLLVIFDIFNLALFLLMLLSTVLAIYICIASRALYLTKWGDNSDRKF